MKFICIHHRNLSPTIVRLLMQACQARGIEFVSLDPTSFDYASHKPWSEPVLLYTISPTPEAHLLQHFLITPVVSTFFRVSHRSYSEMGGLRAITIHEKAGIPMPKTVFVVSKDRHLLRHAIDAVGGFPVVVKVTGGSHGAGVVKVDSFATFFSLVDYLRWQKVPVMVRQFIPVTFSARLIVLGNRVIDSLSYGVPAYDFRSNTDQSVNVTPQIFPEYIQQVACRAVELLDLEFGGVDILIDRDGNPFVTEVNFPCNFARAQVLTGTDIAGLMIDHLVAKAHHLYVPATSPSRLTR